MRVLADTHVLLWWLADDARLAPRHRSALDDPRNRVYFSAVSIAEIAIKTSLGKLEPPEDAAPALESRGFVELPLTAAHATELRSLPLHHRDPFDRMLIAQGRVEGMTIATADPAFRDYEVPLL